MAFSFIFAPATTATGAELDGVLNQASLLGTIPCTVVGQNALTLTPYTTPTAGTPPLALQPLLRFSGVAVQTNSGAVVATIGTFPAFSVYKDSATGPVALTGNEIIAANTFTLTYDAALNGGAGGYHLSTSPALAAGTVTSVVAGAGLAGGTITSAGTLALGAIGAHLMLANATNGSALPIATSISVYLDNAVANTQGAIITRNASVWAALAPGTSLSALLSQGTGANVAYGTVPTPYTTGTFTPTLVGSSVAGSPTYTGQAGFYVQMGKVVVFTFSVSITSLGSAAGNIAIAGLPFSSNSTTGQTLPVSALTGLTNTASYTWIVARVLPSTTQIGLFQNGSGQAEATITNTNCAATLTIVGSGTYITA